LKKVPPIIDGIYHLSLVTFTDSTTPSILASILLSISKLEDYNAPLSPGLVKT